MNLGVLFTGKLSPSFDAAIHKIQESLGKLESTTKKVTEAQGKQVEGTLRLQKGLQGYIRNVEYLLKIQMRWYGARFLLFALADLPVQATKSIIGYAAEIDNARGEMLRWAATSGSVSKDVIKDTEEIIKAIRKVTTEYPVLFEDMSKSAQAFLGAGIGYDTVKEMIPMLAQLRTGFKEIGMDQFAVALTGFFKTFKLSIIEGKTEAEKIGKIMDSIMKAQAEGIIRPEQFTKVIQYLGNISHLAGLSIDQMLALSVAITDTGIAASSASRTLASAMAGISSPKARIALEKGFGIILKDEIQLGSQFLEVIEKIKKKIGTGEPVALGWFSQLQKLLSKEQSRALMALIAQFDTFYDIQKKLEGATGGLKLAADVMSKPFPKQWEIFVNILKEIGQVTTDNTSFFKDFIGVIIEMGKGVLVATDRTGMYSDKLNELGAVGKLVYLSMVILINGLRPILIILRDTIHDLGILIDYLMVAVDWWSKLFGVTDMAGKKLEDYKKIANQFTVEKAKNEISLLTDQFKALLKVQKELEDRSLFAKVFESFLEGITWDFYKGDTKKIQEQINLVLDMLVIARKKYADLTKPEEKPVIKKGAPPPKIEEKSFESAIIASKRTIANAEYEIEKAKHDLSLKKLDNKHKLELIKDEEYYATKEKLLNDWAIKEKKVLDDEYKDVFEEHNKAIAKAKTKEEIEKADFAKRADEKRLEAKKEIINKVREGQTDDTITEKELKNIELKKEAIEHLYKLGGIQREEDVAQVKFSIETKQSLNEWLFSQNLIDADKYYTENKKLIEEDYQTNKANLEREFEDYQEYNREKQIELKNNSIELDKLRKELIEKEKQLNKDLLAIDNDRIKAQEDNRRKEYDDWDKLYSDEKVFGVVKRFTEKAYNEFFKLGKTTKEIFAAVFDSMESSLSDFFYDAWTGQLKSAEDYFISFAQSVLRVWANLMSEMVVRWLWMQAITKIGGGAVAGAGGGPTITAGEGQIVTHKGGIIGEDYFPKRTVSPSLFDYAPRLHHGLNPDEFPAILQKGEEVISKKDRERKTVIEPKYNINLNISAIDSQSFQSYLNMNRDALAKTIIGMRGDNHPIRRA